MPARSFTIVKPRVLSRWQLLAFPALGEPWYGGSGPRIKVPSLSSYGDMNVKGDASEPTPASKLEGLETPCLAENDCGVNSTAPLL